MESHAQSVGDNLIDLLSFTLRLGASYVADRRSVSYFPQGGNQYTSNGVKVIKVSLDCDLWLDPSTVKLFDNITNTTQVAVPGGTDIHTHVDTLLQPLATGAWGCFRRYIDFYYRLHE